MLKGPKRMPSRFLVWLKRVLAGAGGMLVLLALLVAFFWYMEASAPVSKSRCDRIQLGMKRRQVEAIIGRPPGTYGNPQFCVLEGRLPRGTVAWYGETESIYVQFNDDGEVIDKSFADFRPMLKMQPRLTDWIAARFR